MRWAAGALAVALFMPAPLGAQTYGTPTPGPAGNDPQVMRMAARDREVHERFSLGLSAEMQSRWADAAAEFERIVALHPREPQYSTAYYDLGIAYARLGKNDEAADAFTSALNADPGFLAAMANLISIDIVRGDIPAARRTADRFVAAAPDSARALYAHGLLALRTGDFAAARRDFGQLLAADASYAVAHYDLGVAQSGLGHYADAEREFAIALDLAPNYARARFALGTVLLREGRRIEARGAFARAASDAAADPALRQLALSMRDAIGTR